MNLARPAVEVNGMDAGQSFHLVHVYDDTITHAVVPVVDAPTGEYFTAAWVERMARALARASGSRRSRASPTLTGDRRGVQLTDVRLSAAVRRAWKHRASNLEASPHIAVTDPRGLYTWLWTQ